MDFYFLPLINPIETIFFMHLIGTQWSFCFVFLFLFLFCFFFFNQMEPNGVDPCLNNWLELSFGVRYYGPV